MPVAEPVTGPSVLLDRFSAAERPSRGKIRPPVKREAIRITPKPKPKPSAAPRATEGFAAWLDSPTARLVLQRESHGSCTAVSPGGTYRGRWQMNAGFWWHYGGLKFARRADLATCHEQDLIAYRGWLDRGWSPWPTAS